ncbi:MAG: glycosyltransferase [Actinobacteria bacterium]|nr:glycosyltransferase [Actinomycetota bacterium]
MKPRSFKILLINWQDITNPYGGGAEVHLHEIFKRVAAAGHDVTLLCCTYKGAPAQEVIDGIKVVRRGNRSLFNYVVPFAYMRLRRKSRFDIVIDDINKIPFYTPLFAREPILAIEHHFFGKSIYLQAPFLSAGYVYYSEKLVPLVYRNTPFAAVSQSTRSELKEMGVRSQIDLLQNAVDIERYRVLSGEKCATPSIGYLGRLKKYKSVEHVLHALLLVKERFPEIKLLIIGDGDYRRELERRAGALGLGDRVKFTGYVSQEDKVKLLNRVWLVVNPSPKEGWGLTVIEANACAVPVIAADSPGLRDSVVDGKTGVLYPYGDINGLGNEIIQLLENEQKRNQLALQARKWAEKFSWDESARKAMEIIGRIVNS